MIGIKLILTNLTSTYYIIYSRCYGDDANALAGRHLTRMLLRCVRFLVILIGITQHALKDG